MRADPIRNQSATRGSDPLDPRWGRPGLILLAALAILFGTGWMTSILALDSGSVSLSRVSAVLLTLAGVSLWLARTRGRSRTTGQTSGDPLPAPGHSGSWRRRSALLVSAVALGFVLWRIPELGREDSHAIVFWIWLGAFGLYGVAVARGPARGDRPTRSKSAILWLGLGFLMLLTLLLRTRELGSVPFTLSGDEASQGLEALKVLSGEIRNPFSTGWLGVPNMSFYYNSWSLAWLGRTVTALRLPWALVGTLSVLVTFFLVRRMAGSRLAWMTAFLLATYHYHIHFSRLGSNQVADTFFLPASLLFLYRGLDRRDQLDWFLSGAAAALAFYFYAGARLTPVVIILSLSYFLLQEKARFWQSHRTGATVAAGAFLVVAGPMLQYAWRYPGDFNARLNQVGIIQSGWFERELLRGESSLSILLDQFQRAALAFNFYPDRTVWYGSQEPLLNPFFGSLFLLGLVCGTLLLFSRERGRKVAPMVLWWWSGMILGGMLTESPPSSQRLITLSIPVCFLMALAASETAELAKGVLRRFPPRAFLAATLLVFAAGSLHFYYRDYTPRRLYGGQNAEMATCIAPTLNRLKRDYRFYFVGAPWMYWGFATLPFLVPDARAVDVSEQALTDSEVRNLLQGENRALFIVHSQRIDEAELLQRRYPEGTLQEVYSPVDGRLMAVLFQYPSGEPGALVE